MKCIAACAAAALFAIAAHASDATEPKAGTQQGKFAICAHESKGLRGEEHQKFMSDCLKGDHEGVAKDKETRHATAEPGAQQNRMRTCNEEAARKNLHGDERRAFMSACLKG